MESRNHQGFNNVADHVCLVGNLVAESGDLNAQLKRIVSYIELIIHSDTEMRTVNQLVIDGVMCS